MTKTYDSTNDTLDHILKVDGYIRIMMDELDYRATVHDNSKLYEPEKELFDVYTPLLKELTFGSNEYNQSLKSLKVALDHHYSVNDHHPEHFENGVNGMSLFAIIEMLADWKASSERQKDSILNLTLCFERFKIEPQLQEIIINTVKFLGWNYK